MIRILLSRKLGEIKWKQADLARASGVRPNTISELYNEVDVNIKLKDLDRICKALGCQPGELLEYVPDADVVPRPIPPKKK